MIRLDPDTLYTRADLAELLKPAGVDADTLLGRIRPRRVMRGLYLGADLLEAYKRAPELAGADPDHGPAAAPQSRPLAGGRRGRPARQKECPGAALIQEFALPKTPRG